MRALENAQKAVKKHKQIKKEAAARDKDRKAAAAAAKKAKADLEAPPHRE